MNKVIPLDYQSPGLKYRTDLSEFWIEYCLSWLFGLGCAYEIFGGDRLICLGGLLIAAPLVAILHQKRKISQGWAIACGYAFSPVMLVVLLLTFFIMRLTG